ncbi:Transcriptional regulator, AcrR family [hydrothermal vent metagenome]|uniref:Transcriptional regulator, AcrR family n=1 Tax=hydrothermal vent metagenome TaxID=652676 RepID=A0A3B0XKG2_9ZZZZ
MSKSPTKKQLTHQRMLDAASQSFRSNGYAGIGVDGIAKAAGVTSGAFYAHLGSKDKAFSAVLESGLDEVIEAIPGFQNEGGSDWVRAFVDYYMGREHRDDLACGCAMTTLSPEVVRAGPELHGNYEKKMKKIAELIANGLEGESKAERLARAWAMLGILIGGLTMARAVKTQKAADEIALSIRTSAINVAGNAKQPLNI